MIFDKIIIEQMFRSNMKYIPLNIKTDFDLMNSLIKIDELILYAKNNGYNTIGITDENMFGCYE